MPSKVFQVEGIGPVTLTKRRGARNIRLSVSARGEVKVSLPTYVPYAVGVRFALGKKDWLQKHLKDKPAATLSDGARVGKSYRLRLVDGPTNGASKVVIKGQEILVYANKLDEPELKAAVERACERALRADAKKLLAYRLNELAQKNDYSYKSLTIKKLSARWGSCSSDKRIALSLYLVQLPWHLIDYVILHELNHTLHMNHQKPFWDQLTAVMPRAKDYRRELKTFRPAILPDAS